MLYLLLLLIIIIIINQIHGWCKLQKLWHNILSLISSDCDRMKSLNIVPSDVKRVLKQKCVSFLRGNIICEGEYVLAPPKIYQ